jgi:hypothetical protein
MSHKGMYIEFFSLAKFLHTLLVNGVSGVSTVLHVMGDRTSINALL